MADLTHTRHPGQMLHTGHPGQAKHDPGTMFATAHTMPNRNNVIPAQAGIHLRVHGPSFGIGSRLRGSDAEVGGGGPEIAGSDAEMGGGSPEMAGSDLEMAGSDKNFTGRAI